LFHSSLFPFKPVSIRLYICKDEFGNGWKTLFLYKIVVANEPLEMKKRIKVV